MVASSRKPPADAKIIYADALTVAEGNECPTISFMLYRDEFGFLFENNASRPNNGALMDLKAKLLMKNQAFVIEAWLYPKKELDWHSCMLNSSQSLKHLIERCYSDVILREATSEELNKVQQFKDEFEGELLISLKWVKHLKV